MGRPGKQTHFWAAVLFTGLGIAASGISLMARDSRWQIFSWLILGASGLAWLMYLRSKQREKVADDALCKPENLPGFPEGQARIIDSGRLPNRYNPRIILNDFEMCHFYVPADRLIFAPLPEHLRIDPTRLVVRYSGGQFYYIVRPQEILLPADPDNTIPGELIITSQRIIFLAAESGFEVPLQSLKLLDCSAHLVDFQVRDRRFTVRTEAACYAEKVLMLLLQPPA